VQLCGEDVLLLRLGLSALGQHVRLCERDSHSRGLSDWCGRKSSWQCPAVVGSLVQAPVMARRRSGAA